MTSPHHSIYPFPYSPTFSPQQKPTILQISTFTESPKHGKFFKENIHSSNVYRDKIHFNKYGPSSPRYFHGLPPPSLNAYEAHLLKHHFPKTPSLATVPNSAYTPWLSAPDTTLHAYFLRTGILSSSVVVPQGPKLCLTQSLFRKQFLNKWKKVSNSDPVNTYVSINIQCINFLKCKKCI